MKKRTATKIPLPEIIIINAARMLLADSLKPEAACIWEQWRATGWPEAVDVPSPGAKRRGEDERADWLCGKPVGNSRPQFSAECSICEMALGGMCWDHSWGGKL